MPTYDYACAACGHRFEVVHGVHGSGPESCPACGSGPVRKAFAAPTVLFKGSGWAKVDRRSAARSGADKKADSDEAPAKTAADTKPSTDRSDTSASTPASGADSKPAATTAD